MRAPTILCPIDFSRASRGALRYAVVIAEHFGARLTLLTVSDPLVIEASELRAGASWSPERTHGDLRRFLEQAVAGRPIKIDVQTRVLTGKPAAAILKQAVADVADLIVMSSRGNSGVRKFFFGATTERVLRETTVPVFISPAHDDGPQDLEQLRLQLHHVLVPLDFAGAVGPQLGVARAIADGLGTTLLLAHVVEPLWFATAVQPDLRTIDAERRHRAELFLMDVASPSSDRRVELLTAFGDPAEEIAKIAMDRHVGVIVMGLHASPRGAPRMGSVTYRVLCLAPTLVLALPPTALSAAEQSARFSTGAASGGPPSRNQCDPVETQA